MNTSKVPVVKRALVDRLKNAPQLAKATITYGHPGDAISQRSVWIAGGKIRQEWGPKGNRARDEWVDFDFTVWTEVAGSQQEATENAYELFAGIENALIADQKGVTLDGQAIEVQVHQNELVEGWQDTERLAVIIGTITVFNRL